MTSCRHKNLEEEYNAARFQNNEAFNQILPPDQELGQKYDPVPKSTPVNPVPDTLPREDRLALTVDKDADNQNNPPCYLPDNEDEANKTIPAGPGKIDWSPMAALTGVRPLVDRYSVTRFSPNEWRAKNLATIKSINDIFSRAARNEHESRTSVMRIDSLIDKTQKESTGELQKRTQIVRKWKQILEEAIKAMQEEIATMEEQRIRLKKSLVVLGVPESIARECIEKRSTRPETELVRDTADEELINELTLIRDTRKLFNKTLADFENQQLENRTARQRLEMDWSDKKEAYDIDSIGLQLNNNSPTILFYPGIVKMPPGQSSLYNWERFSRETVEECEKNRQRSIKLRQTLNSVLASAARDMRTQADVVEKALISRINCTQENLQRFENDLQEILKKLADTENRIDSLHRTISGYDAAMKVAQTRLYNRSFRSNVENCRDNAQQDLINEVKIIHSGVSNILGELQNAEKIKTDLSTTRNSLEHEIMLKRRTLMIDRDRVMLLRSHYPSAQALSGVSG